MATVDLSSPTADGRSAGLTGYLARPTSPGPWPGVVAIFEAFGLDDVMRRHCDRLAAMGFLTLMPDLYAEGGRLRCVASTLRQVAAGSGRAFADLEAARQWLLASPECTGRVGAVGFCMGGGFALAVADRGFDAVAPNYGFLPRDLDERVQDFCPVVASYGGRDRMLPRAARRLEAALEGAGVPHDVKEYPQAGHSFLNDERNGPALMRPWMAVVHAGPEPSAATDAWPRIESFLHTHLADRADETDEAGDS